MRRADAPRPRAVQLLATCLVDHLYPRVGLAAADVLERAGLEVVVPEGQTCCGQPAFNAGCQDDARADGTSHGRRPHQQRCAGRRAVGIVRRHAGASRARAARRRTGLRPSRGRPRRTARTSSRSSSWTSLARLTCGACAREAMTYHPSCHGLRGLGVRDQPHRAARCGGEHRSAARCPMPRPAAASAACSPSR